MLPTNLTMENLIIIGKTKPEMIIADAIKQIEYRHRLPRKPLTYRDYIREIKDFYFLSPHRMPKGMRIKLREVLQKRETRRILRNQLIDVRGTYAGPLALRYVEKVKAALQESYEKVGYRRAVGYWGGQHTVRFNVSPWGKTGDPNGYHVYGKSKKTYHVHHKYAGINSEHTLVVPLGWYTNVYAQGLAVVENNLILYAEPYKSSRSNVLLYKVWYVHQGVGFNLHIRDGYVARAAGEPAACCLLAQTSAGALRKLSFLKAS